MGFWEYQEGGANLSTTPSIDHEILKQKLYRRIKDKDVLWLFNVLIDTLSKSFFNC